MTSRQWVDSRKKGISGFINTRTTYQTWYLQIWHAWRVLQGESNELWDVERTKEKSHSNCQDFGLWLLRNHFYERGTHLQFGFHERKWLISCCIYKDLQLRLRFCDVWEGVETNDDKSSVFFVPQVFQESDRKAIFSFHSPFEDILYKRIQNWTEKLGRKKQSGKLKVLRLVRLDLWALASLFKLAGRS